MGVIEKHPQLATDGIALRRFGQQVDRGPCRRAYPSVLDSARRRQRATGGRHRDRILAALPEARRSRSARCAVKDIVDRFGEEIAYFGNAADHVLPG